MRYGSICSGIESASAAWLPLGWECAFLSEIDRYANQVLRYHYPNTPNHGDFTQITKEDADGIELIVAGTPCQDFSVAGLREGITGDRGNLTLEFVKLLERTRPTWLLWENVPGVLSSWSDAEEDPETGWITQTNDFDQFLAALSELGYQWAWRILDAQFYGVPQRRRRVFLVGHLGSWRGPAAVLFERESLSGHPPPSREEREEATSYTAHGFGTYCEGVGPLRRSGGGIGGGSETLVPYHRHGSNVGEMGTLKGSSVTQGVPFVPHHIAFSAKDDGRDALVEQSPTLLHQATSVAIAFADSAPTLRADAGPPKDYSNMCGRLVGHHQPVPFSVNQRREGSLRAVHGIIDSLRVRRLMPIECERLQGFEDGYTERGIDEDGNEVEISDTQRYKMLGNSKAVPVVQWIGERIQMIDAMMK